MTSIRLIYVTCPDIRQAESLSRLLLEEKLAACVNLIPQMTSYYWWKGNIETANEIVLIVKTTEEWVDKAIAKIKNNHPYEIPCAISFAIEKGNEEYLEWLSSCVKPS
jgi:periplasmic divalent cation tolerance protein